jgi:phage FluMu protein Com
MSKKSKKTTLQCLDCMTVFKRTLTNTVFAIKCPECRRFDIQPLTNGLTSRRQMKMKEMGIY